ncbi:MAG: hypothetical protein U5R46_06090 [Gammaproteobacteria bacterium]|nr:hypothetical protein [Gammaproteobacteria bacterium]
MLIHPGVEVKSVEGHALRTYGNLREPRPHVGVETISVHPEVIGRIAKPDEAG